MFVTISLPAWLALVLTLAYLAIALTG